MSKAKSYFIKTYGCAMNYSDSDKIAVVLKSAGYVLADSIEVADLIVLNSCSVRKQAEDKVMGWGIKERNTPFHEKIYVLTGCMAVRYDRKTGKVDEKYAKAIKRRMKWVDIFMDIKCMAALPTAIEKVESKGGLITKGKRQITVTIESLKELDLENYYLESNNAESDLYRGLFPISVGCDNFCSYCIVPFSRGELMFRSYEQIVSEVKDFINKGGKMVTLLGQNVNNWKGRRGTTQIDFADLVKAICDIEGDFWLTFLSSNPMDFTDKLGDLLVNETKIMKQMNLAVQSGSNEILKRMNRRYTVERYVEIAEKIKSQSSEFRLTTDIIVGFPGETVEEFEKTVELLKKVDFDMVYVGKYSPREGSIASRLEETVDQSEKERREIAVKALVNAVRNQNHKTSLAKQSKF